MPCIGCILFEMMNLVNNFNITVNFVIYVVNNLNPKGYRELCIESIQIRHFSYEWSYIVRSNWKLDSKKEQNSYQPSDKVTKNQFECIKIQIQIFGECIKKRN